MASIMRSTTSAVRHLFAPVDPADPWRRRMNDDDIDALMRVVEALLRHVDPRIVHPERLPAQGAALLVGNHSMYGIDSFALYPQIWKAVRRLPRGLGERSFWKVPVVNRFVTHCGGVPGTRDVAVELLRKGELALVYPGGALESFKGERGKYRLRWEGRHGFIHVAARAGAPIVPVMAAGIDDAYRYLFRDRWFVPRVFGGGDPRFSFPVPIGLGVLPLPGRFRYHIGEPIQPPTPAELEEPGAVEAFHRDVRDACQAQLDEAVRAWRLEVGASFN